MNKPSTKFFSERQSGVLCHPTSLPSGDLGPDAYHFINFLKLSGFTLWQILPLNPTDDENSPYTSSSSLALSTKLISPFLLKQWNWLPEEASSLSDSILAIACEYFKDNASAGDKRRYKKFYVDQSHWLPDYALFKSIKSAENNLPWHKWPAALRDRTPKALQAARDKHAIEIEEIIFSQFVVDRQWQVLRKYAAERGISIFGDLPIFVSHDSVDVWTNRELFHLLKNGEPKVVAGVPPDYFSETGQRWGNPLYDWKAMQKNDFAWWRQRMQRQLELYDIIRIDHFRGLEAYWEIKASEETAVKGKWVKAPGEALFKSLVKHLGQLPLVAEDLGVITPKVTALRKKFNLPGMKILQFAFVEDYNNAYLPHQHEKDSVAYSGTHDNDTTLGWYRGLDSNSQARVNDYFSCSERDMPWPMVRATLASVAQTAIVPMQDILGLDNSARMNVPGVPKGNWQWRFNWGQVPENLSQDLLKMNKLYGRSEV
ncbi:MAG: 4-alpha-glucanotransferase [Sulfuriflexus sp.]|nr:4-alpha-glucanotransferase [Sulfuriflexus sp.]